jgi:NAD(P)-dependent dehydrogenase (short-subunit alcohol dehydrogenase family)
MSEAQPLAGMTAFVTGGGGGIGRSIVKILAKDGANVVMIGRRLEVLEKARTSILKEVPAAVIGMHAGDASSEDDMRAGLAKACQYTGRLDILVPLVGTGDFIPILLETVENFRRLLDLNLVTAFIAMKHGVPLMTKGGSIVCISSNVAELPFPYLAAYCAAKAGLEQFARCAADEFSRANVRVNCVRPGLTRTDNRAASFDAPSVIQPIIDQIPLGRGGHPDDTARAVRFLAGPESAWVTGTSFAVDGGQELRRNPDQTEMLRQLHGAEKIDRALKGIVD